MRSSSYFKTISRILIHIVIGFLISLWCSGCASFGGGNLQELETLPTAPVVPPKVKLTFALPSHKHDFMGIDRRLAMKYALNGFEETNYFSEVGPKVDNPDVQITVRYQRKIEKITKHSVFCLVTLFLYCPEQENHHFIVDPVTTHQLIQGVARNRDPFLFANGPDMGHSYGQRPIIYLRPRRPSYLKQKL